MSDDLILVTGGAGFIGSHLAEALVGAGHRVRVADDLSSGRLENLAAVMNRIEFLRTDISSFANAAAACLGCRVVFHLASLVSVAQSVSNPLESHRRTAETTLNVLEAARHRGVQRVIVASTAAVYGNTPDLPKREDMKPNPASPYAAAKLTAEAYAQVYAHLYGLQTLSLRFFNVYGPRQDPNSPYSGVISRFVRAYRQGASLTVFGDGRQTRDFVSVRDVVAGLVAAMQTPVADGSVINLATGQETDLLTLIDLLARIAGKRMPTEFQPARPGDVRRSVADVSRAKEILGFEAKVNLEVGLRQLWESDE